MENNILLEEIRSLKNKVEEIGNFITEMKSDYKVLDEKIELSTNDVLRLLGISKSSLCRWRQINAIPYRYVNINHVVYPFKGLYNAIKYGDASFKGFRRVEALQRLSAYKEGLIKGYLGSENNENKDLYV